MLQNSRELDINTGKITTTISDDNSGFKNRTRCKPTALALFDSRWRQTRNSYFACLLFILPSRIDWCCALSRQSLYNLTASLVFARLSCIKSVALLFFHVLLSSLKDDDKCFNRILHILYSAERWLSSLPIDVATEKNIAGRANIRFSSCNTIVC